MPSVLDLLHRLVVYFAATHAQSLLVLPLAYHVESSSQPPEVVGFIVGGFMHVPHVEQQEMNAIISSPLSIPVRLHLLTGYALIHSQSLLGLFKTCQDELSS